MSAFAAAGLGTAGAAVAVAPSVVDGANLDFFLRRGGCAGGGLVVLDVDTADVSLFASSLRLLFLEDMLVLICFLACEMCCICFGRCTLNE